MEPTASTSSRRRVHRGGVSPPHQPPGDPHLHTHVLVANATRSDDGWGTLDARHIYLHARTAGFLYQAQLRAELVDHLGVEWTAVRHGIAEIVGIPHR